MSRPGLLPTTSENKQHVGSLELVKGKQTVFSRSSIFSNFGSKRPSGPVGNSVTHHTDPLHVFQDCSKFNQSWKLLCGASESPGHPLSFEYSIVGSISSRFRCRARFLLKKGIFVKIVYFCQFSENLKIQDPKQSKTNSRKSSRRYRFLCHLRAFYSLWT